QSVTVQASPANGTYRPNPALGSGSYGVARLELEQASGGIALRRDLRGQVSLEVGDGPDNYVRAVGHGLWTARFGGSELQSTLYLAAGSNGLPPHRSFVLGGRGTLVGEPFRAYGGREMALGRLEWRFEVPVPALSLGSYASTGQHLVVAPFVAAGYAGRPYQSLPWTETDGIRPVAGIAVEWLMRIIRLEAGIGLRDGRVGVTIDVNRDWWGLL
ncbi:MAG: hypothetical protein ACJ8AX_07520, partial [Gemmatimonadales bacterium]